MILKQLDLQQLNFLIEEKYIKCQKHPEADLYIYNYAEKAQFERFWNEYTLSARGLVLNAQGDVIARPFPKFFNIQEHDYLPNEPFEVYEKMDGSLGILYWLEGKPYISSRGSFDSEQSEKATQMLYTKYKNIITTLDQSKTYLFEIIYPENRIVVNYEEEEKLVLLGIVDTKTGEEEPIKEFGFPIPQKFKNKSLDNLLTTQKENFEGFVVRFSGGLRVKIKLEEYLRIHRVVTNITSYTVWEMLKHNQSIEDWLVNVPDEFYDWVKIQVDEIMTNFKHIEQKATSEIKIFSTEKETALYTLTCQYPSVMFAMMKGKDPSEYIWKKVKPEYKRALSNFEV